MKAFIVWIGDHSVGIDDQVTELEIPLEAESMHAWGSEYRQGIHAALKQLGEAICEEPLYTRLEDECWDCGKPTCDGGCPCNLVYDDQD